MKLIDKDILVAELNKRIIDAPVNNIGHQRVWAYNDVKDIIDSLEVKEGDLDTGFGVCWGEYCDCGGNTNDYEVAKHFFELGLKAQKE